VQTPTDPFEPATLRMITRPKGAEMALARATKAEVTAALNRQAKNPIRLDGWLPPGEGVIYLKAPGKRDIQFSTGSGSSYRRTPTQEVEIEARDEWTRFSILITPEHNFKPTAGGAVNGNFYW